MRLIAVIALSCALTTSAADARPKHARHSSQGVSQCVPDNDGRQVCSGPVARLQRHATDATDANGNRLDPRPRAWCGWQMRQWMGVSDRAFNLARNWQRYGSRAHGPAVGVIVVWPHHVAVITGRTETGWVLRSGNDGHAIRERERSLRGAIAFRQPNRMAGL